MTMEKSRAVSIVAGEGYAVTQFYLSGLACSSDGDAAGISHRQWEDQRCGVGQIQPVCEGRATFCFLR